jgi:hypothetical protein
MACICDDRCCSKSDFEKSIDLLYHLGILKKKGSRRNGLRDDEENLNPMIDNDWINCQFLVIDEGGMLELRKLYRTKAETTVIACMKSIAHNDPRVQTSFSYHTSTMP